MNLAFFDKKATKKTKLQEKELAKIRVWHPNCFLFVLNVQPEIQNCNGLYQKFQSRAMIPLDCNCNSSKMNYFWEKYKLADKPLKHNFFHFNKMSQS